jgi:DNA-binding GntR family transcriptional regulator
MVAQKQNGLTMAQVVRPPTLTTAVANTLRDAILTGKLSPGAPLREEELCIELGVSRGTVREALRMLCDEKLVEVFPHRGASVVEVSYEKAGEVYTLRALLEPYAVRLALEKHAYTQQDLDVLTELVHRLGECYRAADWLGEIKADREFHSRLCAASQHQLVLSTLAGLHSLTAIYLLSTGVVQAEPVSAERSHLAILDALRSGIPERGEEVVRQLVVQTGEAVLRRIKVPNPSKTRRSPGRPRKTTAEQPV